jgi:hypothetical protein
MLLKFCNHFVKATNNKFILFDKVLAIRDKQNNLTMFWNVVGLYSLNKFMYSVGLANPWKKKKEKGFHCTTNF